MKLIALLLLASTMAFADTPQTTTPPPALAPVKQVDTPGVVKARLKAYKLQQKEAARVAKLQTALALEQIKYNQALQAGQALVAAEGGK